MHPYGLNQNDFFTVDAALEFKEKKNAITLAHTFNAFFSCLFWFGPENHSDWFHLQAVFNFILFQIVSVNKHHLLMENFNIEVSLGNLI